MRPMSYSDRTYAITDIEEASNDLEGNISLSIYDLRRTKIITSEVEQLLRHKLLGCGSFVANNTNGRLVQMLITITKVTSLRNYNMDITTVTISADPINNNPKNPQPGHYGYQLEHNGKRRESYHVKLSEQPIYHRYIDGKHVHDILICDYTKNRIRYTVRQELTFA